MASKVKGGASPKAGTLSLSELQAFNKLYPKDRRLSNAELKAISEGIRDLKLSKGGSPMKKKTKYMAKGGMKKTKYMAKGGAAKKTKMYSRGGAAKRR